MTGDIPKLLKGDFLRWDDYRFLKLSSLFSTAFSKVSSMNYLNFIIRIRRYKSLKRRISSVASPPLSILIWLSTVLWAFKQVLITQAF